MDHFNQHHTYCIYVTEGALSCFAMYNFWSNMSVLDKVLNFLWLTQVIASTLCTLCGFAKISEYYMVSPNNRFRSTGFRRV